MLIFSLLLSLWFQLDTDPYIQSIQREFKFKFKFKTEGKVFYYLKSKLQIQLQYKSNIQVKYKYNYKQNGHYMKKYIFDPQLTFIRLLTFGQTVNQV